MDKNGFREVISEETNPDGKRMKITKIYHPEKRGKSERGTVRVAAYCRVSTRSEDQLNSYEAQQSVYTEMINGREGWELAGIYADRGLTGINAKNRKQFQRMIRDCDNGRIDCIICKSLSRFARSTKDALFYIRHLQELRIRVIFEKEEIDTDSSFSEMMLTILAAFAEEESRSISENIKWTRRKKAMAGDPLLPRLYGYRKSGDNYEVVPEEADTVRLIFALYERGVSSVKIAEILSEKGIQTLTGKEKWFPDVICGIIKNEKYIGDCRTQKTYKKDVTDSREYKNCGELPSVYIKNHHEAIVSRKQFERCGTILDLRRAGTPAKYPFGEYLRCPYCGHLLYFYSRKPTDRYFFCEGEEWETACRKFIIDAGSVENAVLEAYKDIDMDAVQQLARSDDSWISAAAENLQRVKAECPVFEKVDYWWLDELVEGIQIRQSPFSLPEMEGGQQPDDSECIISVFWKCGLQSSMPSRMSEERRIRGWGLISHYLKGSGD